MAGITLRLAAVGAACLVAFAMPASGRGGGGFHGGGGGGGFHGGGGGGGFHGGGGFRGGAAPSFARPSFSRAAPSFSHRAMRSSARPSFRGGRVAHSFSRPTVRTGMRSFSRSAMRGNRSLGGTRVGARGAGSRLSATRLNGARSSQGCESGGRQRDDQKDEDCHRIPGFGRDEAAAGHQTMEVHVDNGTGQRRHRPEPEPPYSRDRQGTEQEDHAEDVPGVHQLEQVDAEAFRRDQRRGDHQAER